MVRAGGIEHVVAAMAAYEGASGIQAAGCAALRNLAVNAGESARVVVAVVLGA